METDTLQDENIHNIKFSDLSLIGELNISEFWFLNLNYISYRLDFRDSEKYNSELNVNY